MGLSLAPNFFKHREAVAAADPAVSSTFPAARGIDARGYETAIANIIFAGTTTSVTFEVLFYDPLADVWVPASPAITFTVTASGSVSFAVQGRRFFFRCTAIAGAAPDVDVDVAAGPARHEEFD